MKKTMKKALSVLLVVVIVLTATPMSGFVGLADILCYVSINTTRIYVLITCNEHRKQMENHKLII